MIRRHRARTAPEVLLERRYRRLLAWYPPAYRAANTEEMLGVALAGAAPEQRWPSLGESVNLVVSGARARFRRLPGGLGSDAWQRAAVLFALIGPVLMATMYAESLLGSVASGLTGFPERLSVSAMVLTAGWSLVAVAAWLRWRWATAIGASLGAVGEAGYASGSASLVVSRWQLVLAAITALAAIALVTRPKSGPQPLTWQALATVLGAAAALTAFPRAESAFTTVTPYPDGAAAVSGPLFGIGGLLRTGLLAVLAITLLTAVIRTGPAARRRVMVLGTPVAAAATVTGWTSMPQWAALGVVPVLALGAALVVLGRYERMRRRVRQEGATSGPAS